MLPGSPQSLAFMVPTASHPICCVILVKEGVAVESGETKVKSVAYRLSVPEPKSFDG